MVSESFEEKGTIQAILSILREAGKPIKTRTVGEGMLKRQLRCPDTTIVFLNKLRKQGLIRGKYSKEQRGWIWWLD
jgi:hypothetical protein